MLVCAASCAGPSNDGPHIGVGDMWRRFDDLPRGRSIVISADPGEIDRARASFMKARRFEKVRPRADGWLAHIEDETNAG